MTDDPNDSDPMAFGKMLLGHLNMPLSGFMAPTLDEAELDKNIRDMKTVAKWMQMNLSVLQTSIQALEMQKATLTTMKNLGKNLNATTDAPTPGAASSKKGAAQRSPHNKKRGGTK